MEAQEGKVLGHQLVPQLLPPIGQMLEDAPVSSENDQERGVDNDAQQRKQKGFIPLIIDKHGTNPLPVLTGADCLQTLAAGLVRLKRPTLHNTRKLQQLTIQFFSRG